MKNWLLTSFLLIAVINTSYTNFDEGMFPLSDLSRANLKEAGLKISEKDIYNPGGIGLVDALVQVGGCSGSFISRHGLIITNHHCAFSAVQLASTPEHDYLTHGFVAQTRAQEIEAKGLTIRITIGYEDVSSKVLDAVIDINDPIERINIINNQQKLIAQEAERQDPNIKAEVSEMFIGKSYILFKYQMIEDVRLVYVPRRTIGEFGGETDNWIWPRHTGDFSFFRAYVGKDGKPAKFSKDNIPFRPKKHLKINTKGVNENDFVFILGYPGRTFRHRPAQYIQYQQEFLLPYIADLYDFQNRTMKDVGAGDRAMAINLATRIQRNANVMKNYQGKMKGLTTLNLLKHKQQEDQALATFINKMPSLQKKYSNLMPAIDSVYKEIFKEAKRELWLTQIHSASNLLNVARSLNTFKKSLTEIAIKENHWQKNMPKLTGYINDLYGSYEQSVDIIILARMLKDAYNLPRDQRVEAVDELFKNRTDFNNIARSIINSSKLGDKNNVDKMLTNMDSLIVFHDPILHLQQQIEQQISSLKTEQDRREGLLNKLMGDYVAVREQFLQKDFIPDANSTLRLTYGYIKGYSPVDATYMAPFTTIAGIIQKGNTGLPEFSYPAAIRDAWEAKNFGSFVKPNLQDVPVNILYDMDTTGGNSGSPIMNAKGELIGVNFDRTYDATINDYAWNESYSRSIGVDIRYVLWTAEKIDHADFILEEIAR
ncbi:S46 family peptidase [Olivibacter sp. SDN3]|nr:S46 family peptidase [Olivibacter sp. SDN3]QNL49079.1 S46 family peptidase [Olivibacter sp. SDN3]